MRRHPIDVVSEEHPPLPGRLLQHRRVLGPRETGDVLDPDDVQVGVPPLRSAQDDVVEVLVGGQPQHAPLLLLAGAAGEQAGADPGRVEVGLDLLAQPRGLMFASGDVRVHSVPVEEVVAEDLVDIRQA